MYRDVKPHWTLNLIQCLIKVWTVYRYKIAGNCAINVYLLLVSPQNRKYDIDATFPEINTRISSFSFFHCSHLADGYPTQQVNKLVNVNKSPVIKTDKDYRFADNIPRTSVHQELTQSASTRGLAGCTSWKNFNKLPW